MRDLLFTAVFLGFFLIGAPTPFAFSLGYVWVDMFAPQRIVSDGLLSHIPVALVMGAAAFGSYLLFDRRSPPKVTALIVLMCVLGFWITLTTTWAVLPGPAWDKYNPSIKVLMCSVFIPFVFRSRAQIEAFLMILLFSITAHLLPWGAKTAIAGGGYGMSLGLGRANSFSLTESSTVAAVSLMSIPLLFALSRHNLLLPPNWLQKLMFYGLAASFAIASIGTFARTAIIGLGVMGAGLWWHSKKKIAFLVVAALLVAAMFHFTSQKWTSRIDTIEDYRAENSALGRLLVWQWTWDFAKWHPLGGGFNVYMIDHLVAPDPDPVTGKPIDLGTRAFHSIYFAVLGEHGYPGLAIYLGIIALAFRSLRAARKLTHGHPEHAWCHDLAGSLQVSLATLLVCASFIDISFSPILWDLLALTVCLGEYARRAVSQSRATDVAATGRAVAFGGRPVPTAARAVPLMPRKQQVARKGLEPPIASALGLGGR